MDKFKRALEIFDPNSFIKLQVRENTINLSTILSSTSNYYSMLCILQKELSIERVANNINVAVKVSFLLKILSSEPDGIWNIFLEEDAIVGKNLLVLHSVENKVSFKTPFKIANDGPDLELGIPLRTVQLISSSVFKLISALLSIKNLSQFIQVSFSSDRIVIYLREDLVTIKLSIPLQSTGIVVSPVEIDCKHFLRALLAVKLECISTQTTEISIGISEEAVTIKINQPLKWTFGSILAIKQKQNE